MNSDISSLTFQSCIERTFSEVGGNGARLSNIMIGSRAEGARFALLRAETPLPKGHPETGAKDAGAAKSGE